MEDTPQARRMIGARIRQAREAVGLHNASEFARRTGVTPTTVYRWEKGTVVPDIFNLFDIAAVTRTSMEWLVSGEGHVEHAVLREWLDTDEGRSAPPEARSFLESLPLLGYRPSHLFYSLALVAWRNGLTVDEAARAAKVTEELRRK